MKANVYVNVMRQGRYVLVAACDAELLGKTLRYGEVDFEVRRSFYGGSLVQVQEAVELIRDATSANLVGSLIVETAVKSGLIHPEAVLMLSGVPYAQRLKP